MASRQRSGGSPFTAPEELRAELKGLTISKLHKTTGLRPNQRTDVMNANKLAMRSLARRVRAIEAEVAEIDDVLNPLVAEERRGIDLSKEAPRRRHQYQLRRQPGDRTRPVIRSTSAPR